MSKGLPLILCLYGWRRMKKRILIVDDEGLIVDLVSGILEKAGYQVFKAYDGKSGQVMMEQTRPDLVIADVIMPEMSGIELLELMKNSQVLRNIPVILLTQKDEFDVVNRAFELGVDLFLPKPFDSRELLHSVDVILKRGD